MKKVFVYTCITGDYDELVELPKNLKNKDKNYSLDYYCFTDNPNIKSKTWRIIGIDNSELLDKVKLQRKIKILGCPEYEKEYDYAFWIDADVRFKTMGGGILNYILDKCDTENYDMYFMKHSDRDCIYDEADICIDYKRDNEKIIKKEMNFLKSENYPKNNGLVASTYFMRRCNDKAISKICKDWFNMVKKYSRRDQLSFNYVVWKNDYNKLQYIDIYWYDNSYFKVVPHNKAKEEIISELEEKIENLNVENKYLENEVSKLVSEKEKINNDYNNIINSKRWKLINKICTILRKK